MGKKSQALSLLSILFGLTNSRRPASPLCLDTSSGLSSTDAVDGRLRWREADLADEDGRIKTEGDSGDVEQKQRPPGLIAKQKFNKRGVWHSHLLADTQEAQRSQSLGLDEVTAPVSSAGRKETVK
ncbi:unnamed protein product [Pleuronectes platessa]|uniref:Uncharacterized protein n=1 Tax=Pleuronectes platessa TaxID=8262 RepID=A0A9N7U6I2_PLEPL|nr:unnamed protein product [Pleuronectes platessa]